MNGLVLFGIIAGFLLICIAIGFIRGMVKSQITCITVIGAAVLSLALTMIIKVVLLDSYTVESLLVSFGISSGESGGLMASQAFAETAIGLISAMLLPIVFVVLFLGIFLLAAFVELIAVTFLRRRIRAVNERASHKFIKTLVYSLVGGLVTVFVFLVPINAYSQIGGALINAADEAGLFEDSPEASSVVEEYIAPVDDSIVMQAYRVLCGDLITDALVDFEVNGQTVHLYDEIETFGDVVCNTMAYVASDTASTDELIRLYADSLERSEVLAYALGDVVFYATDAWNEGEDFIGIQRPESGELFDEMVSDMIHIMNKDSQKADNLRADLYTLADVIVILDEYGLLNNLSDDAALTDTVGGNGLVKALTDKLSENTSMKPLVATINRIGMRAIATSLDLEGVGRAEYDPLLGDIATTLNTTAHISREARIELIQGELARAFADADVEIDGEVIEVYAENLVDEFGNSDDLTSNDISHYLLSHSVD